MIEIYLKEKNAYKTLHPFLISGNVVDNLDKEIDSLEIILDNSDLRFSESWILPKGEKIEIKDNGVSLGIFYIDEVAYSASKKSKTATVRALAVKFKKKNLRNIYYAEFENTTFLSVMQDLCKSANLKFQTNVKDFKIDDISFADMTKGQVIAQLAEAYNCYAKIKDNTAIIIDREIKKNEKNEIDKYIIDLEYKIVSKSTSPRPPKKAKAWDWENDKGVEFGFDDGELEDRTGQPTVPTYSQWRGGMEKD